MLDAQPGRALAAVVVAVECRLAWIFPVMELQRAKFCKIVRPTGPDFSGWNWVAQTLPRCRAEQKSTP